MLRDDPIPNWWPRKYDAKTLEALHAMERMELINILANPAFHDLLTTGWRGVSGKDEVLLGVLEDLIYRMRNAINAEIPSSDDSAPGSSAIINQAPAFDDADNARG